MPKAFLKYLALLAQWLILCAYVKPFIKTNKTDANDAQAICEAAGRPSMHFVAPKTIKQQDIQSLHRIRDRLIKTRTSIANQIRGLMAEYEIIVSKGIGHLCREIPMVLEDSENELTMCSREWLNELQQELLEIDRRIENYNTKLQAICQQTMTCQRLTQIEGIATISATALVAAIGDPNHFKNGRQLAAWLGLVPRAMGQW